jgi:hypothetical protein
MKHAAEVLRCGAVYTVFCACGWVSDPGTAEQVSAAWAQHLAGAQTGKK